MKNEIKTCCICGNTFVGWGNNPWPVKDDGECCDECNDKVVLIARLKMMYSKGDNELCK